MEKREAVARSTQVVIAALNEEQGIGLTIAELKETLGKTRILVVDGNSTDKTTEVSQKMGAHIVYQDGTGKGDALAKAMTHVDLEVDYVVIIDADYTYPAEAIPDMIRLLRANPTVGMVSGNRFNGNLDKEALHTVLYFGNRFLAFVHNLFSRMTLRDPLSGLRVVRAQILRGWNVKSKGFDIEVELNYKVKRAGFSIKEVPIQYRPRLGEKKLKITDGVSILKRIVLESAY